MVFSSMELEISKNCVKHTHTLINSPKYPVCVCVLISLFSLVFHFSILAHNAVSSKFISSVHPYELSHPQNLFQCEFTQTYIRVNMGVE